MTISYKKCTVVSDACPVEGTVLGYYPNLGSGIFFTVAFGIFLVAAVVLGVWKKTWTYTAAITVGLVLETAGYVGRILLNANPWNSSAFQLQICTIILAPTFICVSIYLTLKHVALNLSPSLSRLPPRWYPRIFLPADLTCLVVQGVGGGIAAAAGKDDEKLLRDGDRAIIAGIVLQVVVLAVFGILGTDYLLRVKKHIASGGSSVTDEERALWTDGRFRQFLFAVIGAFGAISIRCIYRIAEMAGGWGNYIMQDEPSFLVLDSSLVLVTVALLTIFHPGIFFPQMANGARNSSSSGGSSSSSSKRSRAKHHSVEEAAEASNEGEAKTETSS
ncbi:RTA-like protein [Moelleriella libera RCEF 2490]|uniref:RTA-like protein n=1 Tax=Moelleriella libera RCEF 2490 TaxID=1081109 RepID=A0A168BJU2_9HYPO|nr:RTA-like protein [Moelleriella libera RCEF 2490]